MMKILFLFLLITVASFHLAVVAAEPERVIYSEDFSGSTLPGVKTENGHSYMSGCEFDVNKVYNGCRYWGDVEIRQSIRFPKQFPKHFCISVKNGGGREKPDYMLYYITFTAGGLSFYAHGLEKNIQDKKGDYRFKDSGFEGFRRLLGDFIQILAQGVGLVNQIAFLVFQPRAARLPLPLVPCVKLFYIVVLSQLSGWSVEQIVLFEQLIKGSLSQRNISLRPFQMH